MPRPATRRPLFSCDRCGVLTPERKLVVRETMRATRYDPAENEAVCVRQTCVGGEDPRDEYDRYDG